MFQKHKVNQKPFQLVFLKHSMVNTVVIRYESSKKKVISLVVKNTKIDVSFRIECLKKISSNIYVCFFSI